MAHVLKQLRHFKVCFHWFVSKFQSFESVKLVVVHVVFSGELVEVLRVLEGRVQREQDVERLNPGLVDGDVQLKIAKSIEFDIFV